MKGLIIRSPHIENILSGKKTLELRGSYTKIRGRIALIKSGTKTIVGYAKLIDVIGPMTLDDMFEYQNQHLAYGHVNYKKIYGWKLSNVLKLEIPEPYIHKKGAIIWVNIPEVE